MDNLHIIVQIDVSFQGSSVTMIAILNATCDVVQTA